MNIFYLDPSPVQSAAMMSNKHIVKMVVETAQILSTVHHMYQSKIAEEVYKPTHKHHPSVVWCTSSVQHYRWVIAHLEALLEEYTHRYHKTHKTSTVAKLLKTPPPNMPDKVFTQPPQAMPDQYKSPSSVQSYRLYYAHEKLFTEDDKIRFKKQLKYIFKTFYSNPLRKHEKELLRIT